MAFFDGLFSGIGSLFGGGDSTPSYVSDPGGLQNFGDYSNLSANYSPSPSSATGSWLSSLGSGLGDLFSTPQATLGTIGKLGSLAGTGLGIAGSIQGMNQGADQQRIFEQQQKAAMDRANQLQGYSAQQAQAASPLLSLGAQGMTGGQLTPALEQQIKDEEQRALAEMRSYLSKSGQNDSSTLRQYEDYIRAQSMVRRNQLAQGLYSAGSQGLTAAASPLSSAMTGSVYGTQFANQNANQAANSTADVWKQIARVMGATG